MGKRLAIVDDSPADAKLLRMAITERDPDIEIIELADGAVAVEFFSAPHADQVAPCDLIVLDLNLPRLTGFEVLEFLKSRTELKEIPVVVMSGSSSRLDQELAHAGGADEYIVKPIELDEIFLIGAQLVDRFLGGPPLPLSQHC